MNFICNYGLVHDKLCGPMLAPSSNNGWIYTAIYQELGFYVDMDLMEHTLRQCIVSLDNEIIINRLPNREPPRTPPLSHDEAIGLYLLGLLSYRRLKANHFVYHGKGEPFGTPVIFDALTGALKLALIAYAKGESHRNNFWKYEIEEIEQVAFRFHPGYIYFMKRNEGIKPHLEERIYWKLFTEQTLSEGSAGSKNILWTMVKRLGDEKLAEKCDPKKNLVEYFGKGHPIAERAKIVFD